MDTLNVAQTAKQVGRSPSAIRAYCKVYDKYLSEGATPEAGKPRRFNAGDIAVFRTVALMKDKQQNDKAIMAYLDTGERLEVDTPIIDSGTEQPQHTSNTTALAPNDLFKQVITPYQEQIELLKDERDYLRKQLEAKEAQIAKASRPWYKKLFGRD